VGQYAVVNWDGVAQMQGVYENSVESYICDALPKQGSS
jgi:hypothetical protein